MNYIEINIYIPDENFQIFSTPLGEILAIADDQHLHALQFLDYTHLSQLIKRIGAQLQTPSSGLRILRQTEKELQEYFDGVRKIFTIPFVMMGTDFQKKAWEALLTIPYGSTLSYNRQADRMTHPRATRAVGNANGKNPIIILIPCHRVVKTTASGKQILLGGYSNGIERKRRLLEIEGVL